MGFLIKSNVVVPAAVLGLSNNNKKPKEWCLTQPQTHMRHDQTAMGYLAQASILQFPPFLHRALMIVAVPTQ
jgi:hypothetical protein